MSGATDDRPARPPEPSEADAGPAGGSDSRPRVEAGTTTRTHRTRRRLPGADEKIRPGARLVEAASISDVGALRIMVLDPDGSAAGYSHDLCNALSERGSDVNLFTSSAWRRAVGRCKTRGYRPRIEFGQAMTERIEAAESAAGRSFWALVRILTDLFTLLRLLPVTRHFDVVHSQGSPVPMLDAAWLWLVGRRATVACTLHQLPSAHDGSGRWSRRARRAMYRTADLLFVHSESDARRLRSELGVEPGRITRIRRGNAAHLRDLGERAPSCPVGPDGVPVVLFMGPPRPENGVDVLLKAGDHLRRTIRDFRIVVAGPADPAMCDYEDLVRDLGLERIVEFRLGHIAEDEIPAYLNQATVLVIPHRCRDHTDVAISACTFGKPVVASRLGALAELVEEADNGILVRPGHAEALAEALTRILRDDGLRRRYETNSLIYARTDLSWRRIGGEMGVAYRSALDGRPRRGRPPLLGHDPRRTSPASGGSSGPRPSCR